MSVPFRFGFRLLQFVFPLLLMFFFAGRADAYSCGDPSKNHCYGVTTWTQGTEYFGAYADITQVQMACPSGCGGFVDDEIWFIDTSSANCLTNQFQMCWVEAGTTVNEGSSPTYFWAGPVKCRADRAIDQEGGAAAGKGRWCVFKPADCGCHGGEDRHNPAKDPQSNLTFSDQQVLAKALGRVRFVILGLRSQPEPHPCYPHSSSGQGMVHLQFG